MDESIEPELLGSVSVRPRPEPHARRLSPRHPPRLSSRCDAFTCAAIAAQAAGMFCDSAQENGCSDCASERTGYPLVYSDESRPRRPRPYRPISFAAGKDAQDKTRSSPDELGPWRLRPYMLKDGTSAAAGDAKNKAADLVLAAACTNELRVDIERQYASRGTPSAHAAGGRADGSASSRMPSATRSTS